MSKIDINALRSLAGRLEKAPGPDREIDADLCCAFKAWPKGFMICNEGSAVSSTSWQRYDSVTDTVAFWQSPAYTASIDAALALVERLLSGWGMSLHMDDGNAQLNLFPPAGSPEEWELYRLAPTPALAILCALVSALIAQAEAGHA